MLNKLDYNAHVEDFKHLLWDCRYSVNIWKEVEQQIRTRYNVNATLTYHNVILDLGLQARFIREQCSDKHHHHGSQEKDMLQRKVEMF